MNTLCKKCDIFVGYGGAGVVEIPSDKDVLWLSIHCWLCGRSRDEIIEENSGVLNAGTS